MKQKINLTIDPDYIKLAKKISIQKKVSISRLFEILLETQKNEATDDNWLSDFHKKNQKLLNKFDDKAELIAKKKRGEKWK